MANQDTMLPKVACSVETICSQQELILHESLYLQKKRAYFRKIVKERVICVKMIVVIIARAQRFACPLDIPVILCYPY